MPDHTHPRLHVEQDLASGRTVEGTPNQAHYLGTVLRQPPGAPVRLFNARDGEFAAAIATLRKDRLTFRLGTRTRAVAAEPDLWLVFSPLKRDATDLVVQKATELGASVLLPVLCARTNTARLNLDRLRAIAIEAAEQSERLTIPALHPPQPLGDLLATWPKGRRIAAAIERMAGPAPGDEGALLVGPEGGFTPAELDVMHVTPFIQPVSLGPRILRAETAALAGLAILQSRHWPFLSQPPAGEPEQTHVQSR